MTSGYTVVLSKLAQEKFDQFIRADRKLGQQISKAIDRLALNPGLGELLRDKWKGYRKYRTGDYRIIYRIEHQQLMIYVITIGHRRDVYE